jgi:hypothetical protein
VLCVDVCVCDPLSPVRATNQLHFLPRFDYIYVMANGKVSEHGTYADLMHDGKDFKTLMDIHTGALSAMGNGNREEKVCVVVVVCVLVCVGVCVGVGGMCWWHALVACVGGMCWWHGPVFEWCGCSGADPIHTASQQKKGWDVVRGR